MRKLIALIVLTMLFGGACSTAEIPTPEIIVVTATPEPTAKPTTTPKSPIDIQIVECGYGGDFGFVTMAGTVTNNTNERIMFLNAAIALIKNDQLIRTDEIYIVGPQKNLGILHGLDYKSKAGGLAPYETLLWSIEYPFDKLTQPFECEASITSVR